jgi:hypothetical protein
MKVVCEKSIWKLPPTSYSGTYCHLEVEESFDSIDWQLNQQMLEVFLHHVSIFDPDLNQLARLSFLALEVSLITKKYLPNFPQF